MILSIATYAGNTNPISLVKNNDGNSPNATFKLPHGPKEDDYQIELYVFIRDDSDGATMYTLPFKVIILPNYNLIEELITEFINDANLTSSNSNSSDSSSNGFVANLKKQTVSEVAAFILKFTAMVNSIPLVSDANSSNSSNSVIFINFKRNISKIFLNIII